MGAPVEFAVSGTKLQTKSAHHTPQPRHVQSAGPEETGIVPPHEIFLSGTSTRTVVLQRPAPDFNQRSKLVHRKKMGAGTHVMLPPVPVNLPEIMIRGLGGASEDGEVPQRAVNPAVPSRRVFLMNGSTILRGRGVRN